MHAYQTYYTACGGSGFHFYAKSESLNAELLNELSRQVNYDTNLEENNSPFALRISPQLSTQGIAITHIVYVGEEYTTTTRNRRKGNFFSHTLVIPADQWKGNLTDFVHWPRWKKGLTQNEISSKPDSLPTLTIHHEPRSLPEEIVQRQDLLKDMILAIFSKDKRGRSILIRSDEKTNAYLTALLYDAFPPVVMTKIGCSSYENRSDRAPEIFGTIRDSDVTLNDEMIKYQVIAFDDFGKSSTLSNDVTEEEQQYADIISHWLVTRQLDELDLFYRFIKEIGCTEIDDKFLLTTNLFFFSYGYLDTEYLTSQKLLLFCKYINELSQESFVTDEIYEKLKTLVTHILKTSKNLSWDDKYVMVIFIVNSPIKNWRDVSEIWWNMFLEAKDNIQQKKIEELTSHIQSKEFEILRIKKLTDNCAQVFESGGSWQVNWLVNDWKKRYNSIFAKRDIIQHLQQINSDEFKLCILPFFYNELENSEQLITLLEYAGFLQNNTSIIRQQQAESLFAFLKHQSDEFKDEIFKQVPVQLLIALWRCEINSTTYKTEKIIRLISTFERNRELQWSDYDPLILEVFLHNQSKDNKKLILWLNHREQLKNLRQNKVAAVALNKSLIEIDQAIDLRLIEAEEIFQESCEWYKIIVDCNVVINPFSKYKLILDIKNFTSSKSFDLEKIRYLERLEQNEAISVWSYIMEKIALADLPLKQHIDIIKIIQEISIYRSAFGSSYIPLLEDVLSNASVVQLHNFLSDWLAECANKSILAFLNKYKKNIANATVNFFENPKNKEYIQFFKTNLKNSVVKNGVDRSDDSLRVKSLALPEWLKKLSSPKSRPIQNFENFMVLVEKVEISRRKKTLSSLSSLFQRKP